MDFDLMSEIKPVAPGAEYLWAGCGAGKEKDDGRRGRNAAADPIVCVG
jgi:hypothetical protein